MNKLFVYGIFLNESMRSRYGMFNPKYATVRNYVTRGGDIVEAVPVDPKFECALTGLIVNVAPYEMAEKGIKDNWERLDALEGGYDRIEIVTIQGEKAFMYVGKEGYDTSEESGDNPSR